MNKEDKIRFLEQENKFLRDELRKRGYFFISAEDKLSTEEKIEIFLNYFKGRLDVIAERYYSKKSQSYGWNPACWWSFKEGCKKGKIKNYCCICPVSQFKKLDSIILKNHFKGEKSHGIGIYPLMQDNTCHLLAIDFDDENWFEDMLSVYKIAVKYELYPLMERSASGCGGHLWLFFESPIKAVKARKLGTFLLQEAMNVNSKLDFKSFDRMFPNQDYMPQGGFGNLIALPLRYNAFLKGNTAFINDLQQVIEHQIEYLASLPKIQESLIDRILHNNMQEDYFFDQQQMGLHLGLESKYSGEIYVKENTMLCIEKKNLNLFTLGILRRLGSMYNPDYYLMQKLKKPIYRVTTPRVLSCYEEDDAYIYLPRGQKYKMTALFSEADIQIESQVCEGHKINVSFKGTLLERQKEPIHQLMKFDMGIMKAVPGFGKTVMALYMIAERKTNTLVIVPSREIQNQWLKRIDEFLIVPQTKLKRDSFVCVYNGSRKRLNGNIDIATAASLANLEDIEGTLSRYGMVVIDECHHAASDTFTKVLRNVKAKYIYGFSATPKRKDGLEKIMYMFCGPIRYETNSFQIQSTYQFKQQLIPRMTTTRILDTEKMYTDLCTDLMNDQVRNYLIMKDIVNEFQNDGKIIVLSERKKHLMIFYEMLRHTDQHVYVLTSETKDRQEIIENVRNLSSEENYILLATSKLLGEGFDLPSLTSLFLVLPISDEARITQYTGRIHRNYEGKDLVKVYDYVDVNIPMMEAMFRKRLKQYQKEGYYLQEQEQLIEVSQMMYEDQNYKDPFLKDVQMAKKEIVIMNSHYEPNKIEQYFDLLQEKAHQNVKIYIALKEGDFKNNELVRLIEGIGAMAVSCDKNMHFIVIDKEIVWYSDFDFFGKSKKESMSTRFHDSNLSEEIIQIMQKSKSCDHMVLTFEV